MKKVIVKLARDLGPKVCKKMNYTASFYQADDAEYCTRLRDKLQEEVDEYLEDKNLEELADILEVVHALAHLEGYSVEQLEAARKKKAHECGGFEKRLIVTYEK